MVNPNPGSRLRIAISRNDDFPGTWIRNGKELELSIPLQKEQYWLLIPYLSNHYRDKKPRRWQWHNKLCRPKQKPFQAIKDLPFI